MYANEKDPWTAGTSSELARFEICQIPETRTAKDFQSIETVEILQIWIQFARKKLYLLLDEYRPWASFVHTSHLNLSNPEQKGF